MVDGRRRPRYFDTEDDPRRPTAKVRSHLRDHLQHIPQPDRGLILLELGRLDRFLVKVQAMHYECDRVDRNARDALVLSKA